MNVRSLEVSWTANRQWTACERPFQRGVTKCNNHHLCDQYALDRFHIVLYSVQCNIPSRVKVER